MAVTSPETEARLAIINFINVEFAPERITAVGDRLHGSLGWKAPAVGVSPVRSEPRTQIEDVLRIRMLVQFYGKWNKQINPEQSVDPSLIEGYAERFRRALRTSDPNTDRVWYFRLLNLDYPLDPTGNVTRFEAQVEALGQNSALIETTG